MGLREEQYNSWHFVPRALAKPAGILVKPLPRSPSPGICASPTPGSNTQCLPSPLRWRHSPLRPLLAQFKSDLGCGHLYSFVVSKWGKMSLPRLHLETSPGKRAEVVKALEVLSWPCNQDTEPSCEMQPRTQHKTHPWNPATEPNTIPATESSHGTQPWNPMQNPAMEHSHGTKHKTQS